MKNRTLAFILFAFLFSMPFGSQAADTVVIGEICTMLGASAMTTDQKNIATCLKPDNGSDLIWKGMTTSGESSPPGTLCGSAILTYTTYYTYGPLTQFGSELKYPITSINTVLTKNEPMANCNGVQIATSCPSGYTLKKVYTVVAGTANTNTALFSCVKN